MKELKLTTLKPNEITVDKIDLEKHVVILINKHFPGVIERDLDRGIKFYRITNTINTTKSKWQTSLQTLLIGIPLNHIIVIDSTTGNKLKFVNGSSGDITVDELSLVKHLIEYKPPGYKKYYLAKNPSYFNPLAPAYTFIDMNYMSGSNTYFESIKDAIAHVKETEPESTIKIYEI